MPVIKRPFRVALHPVPEESINNMYGVIEAKLRTLYENQEIIYRAIQRLQESVDEIKGL